MKRKKKLKHSGGREWTKIGTWKQHFHFCATSSLNKQIMLTSTVRSQHGLKVILNVSPFPQWLMSYIYQWSTTLHQHHIFETGYPLKLSVTHIHKDKSVRISQYSFLWHSCDQSRIGNKTCYHHIRGKNFIYKIKIIIKHIPSTSSSYQHKHWSLQLCSCYFTLERRDLGSLQW